MEAYKKVSEERITINLKTLNDFKEKLGEQKKTGLYEYKVKVTALVAKNTHLLKKLAAYKASCKELWNAFKAELNYDMEQLEKSFINLAVRNTNNNY
jgi:hypothetical protein